MTTLNLELNDQTLIAAEKVKIASGDIESVFLAVDFDSAWDNFNNRTASFYTSHNSEPHEVLMIDNKCTVPKEVLEKVGTLYIGVIGATSDGTAIKTSSIASFKIVQGAQHSHTTLTPELDLYQQYLAAMKAETGPAFAAIRADYEAEKARLQAEFESFKNNIGDLVKGYVVWNNPNAEVSFAAQTITGLDLSQYSRFVIQFCNITSNTPTFTYCEGHFSTKDIVYGQCFTRLINGEEVSCMRELIIRDNEIQFYACLPAYNQYLVPVKVIAYRY